MLTEKPMRKLNCRLLVIGRQLKKNGRAWAVLKTKLDFHTYYPLFLNISGKKCIVVGGGRVAERKVERLLDCGAAVEVISQEMTPLLMDYCRKGEIIHRKGEFEGSMLSGAFLVIAATNDMLVNGQVAKDARSRGILLNIVDDPKQCDFIVPSLIKRGDLAIAISTGGKSPALAKKIREELDECYGNEYFLLLDILGELRERMIAERRDSDRNREVFEAVVNSDILDYIRAGRFDQLGALIRRLTGIEMEVKKT
jgi:precorrin-2 dehydrogenase / sirohydrochlorin ferrochelatase